MHHSAVLSACDICSWTESQPTVRRTKLKVVDASVAAVVSACSSCQRLAQILAEKPKIWAGDSPKPASSMACPCIAYFNQQVHASKRQLTIWSDNEAAASIASSAWHTIHSVFQHLAGDGAIAEGLASLPVKATHLHGSCQ